MPGLVLEITVAVPFSDFLRVNAVRGGPLSIVVQAVGIGDLQLPRQMLDNEAGSVRWIREKGTEKTHRAKLDGIPQAVVSPSMRRDLGRPGRSIWLLARAMALRHNGRSAGPAPA
jgi:hypothetical protein